MRKLFKNSKQVLAFILAFAVLSVSMFTGAVLSVGAASEVLYWDGTYTEPTDIDGDGIYDIDEASDLAYLAYKAKDNTYETYGKTYKVIDGVKAIVLQPTSLSAVKDLTSVSDVKTFFTTNSASAFTWNVFGYKGEYPFQGTLDGNGATIYGMYNDAVNGTTTNYTGLLGLVDQGAVIKNLGIENSYITTGTGMMGLIAAATANNNAEWNKTENLGDGTITIENCVIANNYTYCSDTVYTRNGITIGAFNGDLFAINNCLVYGNEAACASGNVGLVGSTNNTADNRVTNTICLGATPYTAATQGNAGMPEVFVNVYTDTIDPVPVPITSWGKTWNDYAGCIIEISAADVIGATAKTAMPALDWANDWFATDSYPVLRSYHNFTVVDNGDGTHSESCDCGCGLATAAEAHSGGKVCTVCGAALTIPDTLYWNGTTASSFSDDSEGTESDPIEIATVAELALMVTQGEGKYYKIADGVKAIYLQSEANAAAIKAITSGENAKTVFSGLTGLYSWKTSDDGTFSGHFDGNGAQIYGLYTKDAGTYYNITSTLFPKATAGSSFKNFAIKNSFVQRFAAVSAVVAQLDGSGVVTFENVEISNNYLATTRYAAGYIATLTCGAANVGLDYSNLLIYGNATYACVTTAGVEDTLAAATSYIAQTAYNSAETETQYNDFKNSIILDCNPVVFNNGNASVPANFANVYINVDITNMDTGTAYEGWNLDWSTNITQISDVTGDAAKTAMPALDWANDWFATDSYPVLRSFHNFAVVDNGDGTHTESCDCGCALTTGAEEHVGTGSCEICGAELTIPDTLYWDGTTTAPEDSDGDGVYEIDAASDIAYLVQAKDNIVTYGKEYKVIDGINAIVMQIKANAAITEATSAAEVKAFFESASDLKEWKTIGYQGKYPFQGTFDGNGTTIYGLYGDWCKYLDDDNTGNDYLANSYCGLFGLIDNGAVIKNVAVANSYYTTNGGMVGMIAAKSVQDDTSWNATDYMGLGTVTLENCIVKNNYIRTNGSNANVGVMLGNIYNGDCFDVSNCLVYGNDAYNNSTAVALGLNGEPHNSADNRLSDSIILGCAPYYVGGTQGNATRPDVFANIYTDTLTPDTASIVNAWDTWSSYDGKLIDISATGAIGAAGKAAMSGLDWANDWFATDSYPVLRSFHNFTVVDNGNGTHSESCDCGCGLATAEETHDFVDVGEATAATCTENGSQAQECSVCGATNTKVITATGHTFGDVVEATDSTCLVAGTIEHKQCTVCEKYFDADAANNSTDYLDDITAPLADCEVEEVAEVSATCTENGTKAHDKCVVCGKTYIDGELVDAADLVIEAGHNLVQVEAKAPTCTEAGYAAYEYCTECDYTTYEEIEALDHDLVQVEAKAATCTEAGYAAYEYCTECDYTTYEEIAALGHTEGDEVIENASANTCTEGGSYDKVVYCTVCNEELSRETVTVDAQGHTAADAIKENEVAATCTEAGSYESVVKCSVCKEELSRETVTVPATGHTEETVKENEVAPTCTEAGSYESVVKCSVCNEEISRETVTVDALGHTAADAVKENEVAATCTEAGSYDKVVYCTVCNEEISRETVTVPETGHTLVQVDAKAPTTTEIGWNAYEYCENCDYTTYEELAVLPQTGWLEDGGKWYYLKASGAMATGWVQVSGKWYYMNTSGVMQTGWVKVSSKWYYMNTSGVMQTGWKLISGTWYYFNTNGSMVANTSKTIGGKTYYFNASGACTNP